MTSRHIYPSDYPPGSHWSLDVTWEILDRLPVGQLTDDQRFLTGGQIAGAILRARADGAWEAQAAMAKAPAPVSRRTVVALTAAMHALRSYEFHNASPDLARATADHLDAIIKEIGATP